MVKNAVKKKVDPRRRYITSADPFDGLDDFRLSSYFRLKFNSIEFPVQYSLFNDEKLGDGEGLRTKEGNFFEDIGTGMYGGTKKISYTNKNPDGNGTIKIEPDITDHKKGILHEFKGIYKSGYVGLTDEQIAKYVLLQSQEYFPNPPSIRFNIFSHGIKGMQAKYKNKNLDELVRGFAGEVRNFISLPFSLIFEFYIQDNKKKSSTRTFTSRHNDERTYKTLTRLCCTAINELITYPEEIFKEFDLDPKRFIIEKRKFPKTFKISGIPVKPFPMLFVYDKEYGKFVSELKGRIDERPLVSERLAKATNGLIGTSPKEEDYDIPEWMKPPKGKDGKPIKEVPF